MSWLAARFGAHTAWPLIIIAGVLAAIALPSMFRAQGENAGYAKAVSEAEERADEIIEQAIEQHQRVRPTPDDFDGLWDHRALYFAPGNSRTGD